LFSVVCIMKIILASVAGVEDGFFQIAWDKFPDLAFALTLVYLTYKVVTFHRDFKQSLLDLSNSFVSFKNDMASAHDRMNKKSEAAKEKIDSHELQINHIYVALVKIDSKIDTHHLETNLRFDAMQKEMNLRFDAMQQQMDLRFGRLDERFGRVDGQFERVDERFVSLRKEMTLQFGNVDKRIDSLETKMDKVIDLLASNRDDNTRSPLRKS